MGKSKKDIPPPTRLDDWRAEAARLGWPPKELDTFATTLTAACEVIEVTRSTITVRRPVRYTFTGVGVDGQTYTRHVDTATIGRWYYHPPPVAIVSDTPYVPPPPPEPPVAVREPCGCGPEHARECEFYRVKPYRYWDRVKAAAAEAVRVGTERQRRDREVLAGPARAVKAKKVRLKTHPNQLGLPR